MGKGIPDRWENYLPLGSCVPGTKFLPFKVPLKVALCRKLPTDEWFTPETLLKDVPKLKAIIDLTNTNRYYNSLEFTNRGIVHKKIMIIGGRSGQLPPPAKVKEFFDAVDELLEILGRDPDALIGVHCTHGLNRTGYLICKYMVSRMEIDPQEAINTFQNARGYPMERPIYINDILKTCTQKNRLDQSINSQRAQPSFHDYQRSYQSYQHQQHQSNRFSRGRPFNCNPRATSEYIPNRPNTSFDNFSRRPTGNYYQTDRFYPEQPRFDWRSSSDGHFSGYNSQRRRPRDSNWRSQN